MSTQFTAVNFDAPRHSKVARGYLPSRVETAADPFGVSYHYESIDAIKADLDIALEGRIEIGRLARRLSTHAKCPAARDLLRYVSDAIDLGATHVQVS